MNIHTINCHTLVDLRCFSEALPKGARLPSALLALSLVIAGDAGLAWSDLTVSQRQTLRRHWPKDYHRTKGRFYPHASFAPALGLTGGIPQTASIRRVLFEALKHLRPCHISTLIWASTPGGMTSRILRNKPWAENQARGREDPFKLLIRMKLLHRRSENRSVFYSLTPAGEKLLLGQWGKAVKTVTVPESTPHLEAA